MCSGAVGQVTLAAVLTTAVLGSSPAVANASAYDDAIARALRLLPQQPREIVIVEGRPTTGQHSDNPRAEAFVNRGQSTVYLVRQAPTLQAAIKGPGIFDLALAAIIWHEMAHIDGADEAAAQQAEEQLWKSFILRRRVDSGIGLRYLELLRKRR